MFKRIKIEDVRIGDYLYHWFYTGSFGPSQIYSRVLRVGAKKIKVLCESGQTAWKYPFFFDGRADSETVPDQSRQRIEAGSLHG